MKTDAIFSECGKYRYVLSRIWEPLEARAMCIELNPSTAKAEDNDPTITRLIGLLRNNGFGGFYMTNLFALVSPYPEDLQTCPDPLKDNDRYLLETSENVTHIVYCWGNFKQATYRAKKVKTMFPHKRINCFGKNANGTPKHPLYLKANTELILF
jgi:hypothetical protein